MIYLDIAREVEQRMVDAARARGLEPSAYASQIVTDAAGTIAAKHLTDEQFENIVNRLAARGRSLPQMPDYAYTRESNYEDHEYR